MNGSLQTNKSRSDRGEQLEEIPAYISNHGFTYRVSTVTSPDISNSSEYIMNNNTRKIETEIADLPFIDQDPNPVENISLRATSPSKRYKRPDFKIEHWGLPLFKIVYVSKRTF